MTKNFILAAIVFLSIYSWKSNAQGIATFSIGLSPEESVLNIPVSINLDICLPIFAPTKDKDWLLEPGKTYTLWYRLLVFNGRFDAAKGEVAWQHYAKPPVMRNE